MPSLNSSLLSLLAHGISLITLIPKEMPVFGNTKTFYNNYSTGIEWAFRYHFGSLAFGSLIVAIVWAIRIIFEYIAVRSYKVIFFRKNWK